MVTSSQCQKKYGKPELENNMVVWDVPGYLEVGFIPKKIYCNKDLVQPLSKAFENLIKSNCVTELKTWDGCFNIRKKRGLNSMSLHSWGLAVDLNAGWNQMGTKGSLSPQFVSCFKDAGMDWGGDWQGRSDPMHFQISKLP
jgi:hypothetical protein